eukprot:5758195-Amphidinium_carterae.5
MKKDYDARKKNMQNNVLRGTKRRGTLHHSTAILGLTLEIQGYSGYLRKGRVNVKLHYIGHHFYTKAAMVRSLRIYTTNGTITSSKRIWSTELQARMARMYRSMETTFCTTKRSKPNKKNRNPKQQIQQPYKPSPQGVAEHNMTHLPYRDGVKSARREVSKSKQHYHKKGALKEQSITEIDYAFIRRGDNDHDKITTASKRFIVENGLETTILQSDSEPPTIELLTEVTRQISHQTGASLHTAYFSTTWKDFIRQELEEILYAAHTEIWREGVRRQADGREYDVIPEELRTELGRATSRTVLQLPQDQQNDREELQPNDRSYKRIGRRVMDTTTRSTTLRTEITSTTNTEATTRNRRQARAQATRLTTRRIKSNRIHTELEISREEAELLKALTSNPEVYKPTLPATEGAEEEPKQVTEETQEKKEEPRTRLTKKTPMTPLQATKDTGVLRLIVNEDAEEGKLMTQTWYDDDNTEYTPQELKDAIKEEHDSLQKTEVSKSEKRRLLRSAQTGHTDKMGHTTKTRQQ